jgi:hypothetical protein
LLKVPGEKSNCSDGSKLPSGLGMSFQAWVLPLEINHASKFGDFDLSMKGLANSQEIKDAEKLPDFKHDMQKINKSCLKQLEEKKQKLKRDWWVCDSVWRTEWISL